MFNSSILDASAIVTATSSGYTARMVSKFRPKVPVVAATISEKAMRQLSLSWGVYPVKAKLGSNTDEVIDYSIKAAQQAGYLKDGELVVITAGVPVGVSGTTNLIKVRVMSEEIVQGIGVGEKTIEGKVCIINPGYDCKCFNEGDILVTTMTDIDMNHYIQKAGAIVTEDGGMTSHAAIVGLNLDKAVVVSATNILNLVKNGETITVDSSRGVIYRGSTRVL